MENLNKGDRSMGILEKLWKQKEIEIEIPVIKNKIGILSGVYSDSKCGMPNDSNVITITFKDDSYLEIWSGDITGLFFFAKNHIGDKISISYSKNPKNNLWCGRLKVHSFKVCR